MSEKINIGEAENAEMNSMDVAAERYERSVLGAHRVSSGFVAGAKWQKDKDARTIEHWRQQVGKLESQIAGMKDREEASRRLVPRMQPDHVPLTEIMAGVIGGREDAAKSFFNVGVMVSDLHADVRSIKNMILALAETTGDRFGAQSRALGHHSRVAGDIVLMVKDVGEKVEAVLDQVTPRDNAVCCDAAESEADHWKHRVKELEDQLGDVMAERDEWKAAAVLLEKATSEPVTDESGVSVGAGSFIPKVPGTLRVGIDPAKPGTDKTVIGIRKAEGSFSITPPVWAGNIVDVASFNGRVLVCCQNGIFTVEGMQLTPLRFVTK